ncbi:MAG TPA: tripartite tricarboxylate transporter substrate binding protein [Burkholderiales bacterium]|nr:tripartite tricarboxylate transporter substrate binding protein [Burkholderiales bacterium]
MQRLCQSLARCVAPALVAAMSAPVSTAAVANAAYPAKPIRVIVGFPPGGGNDEIARIVGPKLAEKSGRAVVIDNRPGAGGNLAAELTAKSPADGYTVLVISSSHPIQGLLKKNLPYDPVKDFAGVAELVVYRSLLVTYPGVPANSVGELLALAKSKPGQINFVSSGNGSASHLAGELFKVAAQVNITHVPYKGSSPALIDLIAGRVQMMFSPLVPVMPHIKANRLRPLAVTSLARSRLLPDLPTINEAGVAGYEFVSWYAVVAPGGTPQPVIAKLNALLNEVMQLPDVKERLQGEDMDVVRNTPQQFDAVRAAMLAKWSKIIRQTGIQAD